MNPTDITSALAVEHARDLRRTADHNRLVALARCCRPSAVVSGLRRVRSWIDRGRLGGPASVPCV